MTRVLEVARFFLWLGVVGFGGPAAHIAIMEKQCVRDRRWIEHDEFVALLGAANLIPGPTSTELAMHIGYRRAGWPGFLAAGACFIAPAALLVGGLAAIYVRYGGSPFLNQVLLVARPLVVIILAVATWHLGRSVLRTRVHLGIAVTVVMLSLLWPHAAAPMPARGDTAPATLGRMVVEFAGVGSVVLGSGYVIVPFFYAAFVTRLGWLDPGQLTDAAAAGQLTPGPVFTVATFIGYLMRGPAGAVAATVGIFLPAFVFAAASVVLLPRIRRLRFADAFLGAVSAAAVGLLAATCVVLAAAAARGLLAALS